MRCYEGLYGGELGVGEDVGIIANYTTLKVDDPAVISDDEDSEDEDEIEMPELIKRVRDDDSDSEDLLGSE